MPRFFLIPLLLLALPATAQQIGPMVASDLNRDGRVERFALLETDRDTVDLQIENTGGGVIHARDIAWRGGIGQQPVLTLAENGSVRLTSMNESIGRNRWHLTLTIAYRDNAYRVAGFTYDAYDTLDLDAHLFCDLNLLSGRGVIRKGQDGPEDPLRTAFPALPVTQWKDSVTWPDACD